MIADQIAGVGAAGDDGVGRARVAVVAVEQTPAAVDARVARARVGAAVVRHAGVRAAIRQNA